jgi:hypothetical protein
MDQAASTKGARRRTISDCLHEGFRVLTKPTESCASFAALGSPGAEVRGSFAKVVAGDAMDGAVGNDVLPALIWFAAWTCVKIPISPVDVSGSLT